MARTKTNGSSNGKLDEAMTNMLQGQAVMLQNQAMMVQTQAALAAQMAAFVAQTAAMEKEAAIFRKETAERFSRIESILLDHSRILLGLPEAVREKIGFK